MIQVNPEYGKGVWTVNKVSRGGKRIVRIQYYVGIREENIPTNSTRHPMSAGFPLLATLDTFWRTARLSRSFH